MAKFVIEYTEERWFSIEIEADSEEEASEKFWTGECDFGNAYQFGGEIHQDITIIERKVVA